jgi:hypothetical protein
MFTCYKNAELHEWQVLIFCSKKPAGQYNLSKKLVNFADVDGECRVKKGRFQPRNKRDRNQRRESIKVPMRGETHRSMKCITTECWFVYRYTIYLLALHINER